MNTEPAWRTDDRCPCCGIRLHITDTPATVTLDCGACGWTLTAELAVSDGAR